MAYIQERKSSDGKTRYRVQVRLRGHPAQTATFERKTDAKRWAQQVEAAIREGRHFKNSEARRHTLGDLVDRYDKEILAQHPKKKRDQSHQMKWWKDQMGAFTLADMTPALLAEYRNRLSSEPTIRGKGKKGPPRGHGTVNRYLAVLSHAFSIAVKEWGWMDENPLKKVTKYKEPRGRVRFLSDEERKELLTACSDSQNPFLYTIVVLALSTGMRSGEILNLMWGDVDFENKRIILQETKNGERRAVPLVGRASELLEEHSKVRRLDTNLLFPGQNPIKPVDIRTAWLNAIEKADIIDFRFHDLRHSAASYLAMNGATLAEIAEVLGHKTLQMVKRYAHFSEQHTATIVSKMNEKIFGE